MRLLAGDVHVWTVALDAEGWADRLHVGGLDPGELARAGRFHFEADRRRFVVSHAAARAILARYLAVTPDAVVYRAIEGRKPELDPGRHGSGLRFNLSHSGELAVMAVSEHEVGVDVERVRRLPDLEALVARWFSPAERCAFADLPTASREPAFFACWTLKEAYLKGCGDGLSRAPDRFTVTVSPDEPPHLAHVEDRVGDETRWILWRLTLPPGYAGAVAIRAPAGEASVPGERGRLHQLAWSCE